MLEKAFKDETGVRQCLMKLPMMYEAVQDEDTRPSLLDKAANAGQGRQCRTRPPMLEKAFKDETGVRQCLMKLPMMYKAVQDEDTRPSLLDKAANAGQGCQVYGYEAAIAMKISREAMSPLTPRANPLAPLRSLS